jgi:hypothetical protein
MKIGGSVVMEQGQPCDMSALSLKLHISDLLLSFVTGPANLCACAQP